MQGELSITGFLDHMDGLQWECRESGEPTQQSNAQKQAGTLAEKGWLRKSKQEPQEKGPQAVHKKSSIKGRAKTQAENSKSEGSTQTAPKKNECKGIETFHG